MNTFTYNVGYIWKRDINIWKRVLNFIYDAQIWFSVFPAHSEGLYNLQTNFSGSLNTQCMYIQFSDYFKIPVTASNDVTLLIFLNKVIGAHSENPQRSCKFSIHRTYCLDFFFMLNLPPVPVKFVSLSF